MFKRKERRVQLNLNFPLHRSKSAPENGCVKSTEGSSLPEACAKGRRGRRFEAGLALRDGTPAAPGPNEVKGGAQNHDQAIGK